MPDGTNQRVTNAILKKDIETLVDKIEALTGNVETWRKEDRAERDKTSKRLNTVEGHVVRCATLWDEHKETHQTIDKDIKDVEGDVKKWSLFGGGGGGALAFIAALFMDR